VFCEVAGVGAAIDGRLLAGAGVAGGTDAGVCAEAVSPQVKVAAISNAKSAATGGQWRGDRGTNMVSV